MISYFEAGKTNISFILRDEYPKLSLSQRQEISQHWEETAGSNFNGRIVCCNGVIKKTGKEIIAGINTSDYATYKWARDHGCEIPGTYTAGDCVLVHTPHDNAIVFAKRSSGGVAFDRDKFSGFGGVLPVPPWTLEPSLFLSFVFSHALDEVTEELEMTAPIKRLKLLGFYYDDSVDKLEFCFSLVASRCSLRGTENDSLVSIPRKEVKDFYMANRDKFETSTKNHLDHWAKKINKINF